MILIFLLGMKHFLQKCTRLQSISLSGCNFAFTAALSQLAQNDTSDAITQVSLRDCTNFDDAALCALAQKFPYVTFVDFVRTGVSSEGVGSFIANFPNLEGICTSVPPIYELIEEFKVFYHVISILLISVV